MGFSIVNSSCIWYSAELGAAGVQDLPPVEGGDVPIRRLDTQPTDGTAGTDSDDDKDKDDKDKDDKNKAGDKK